MFSSTRLSHSEGDSSNPSQLVTTESSSSSSILRAISLPKSQSASDSPPPLPHRSSEPKNIYPQRGSTLLPANESKKVPHAGIVAMQSILEKNDKEMKAKNVKAPDDSPSEQNFVYSGAELEFKLDLEFEFDDIRPRVTSQKIGG